MYTILVTGSRDWTDAEHIRSVFREFDEFKGHEGIRLIEGGARGVDMFGRHAAQRLGWEVVTVPADWALHGKAAGPIRNRAMLDMKPDIVIAFWDGKSRGTKDCFQEASKRGIDICIYGPDGVKLGDIYGKD